MLLFCFLVFNVNMQLGNQSILTVSPIDIQDTRKNVSHFFLGNLSQLETDGKLIFIRGMNELQVVVVNKSGSVIQQIGRKGQGPGEFDNDVTAISLDPKSNHLWVLSSLYNRGSLFDLNGTFKSTFKLAHNPFINFGSTSNVFASHNGSIIFPWGSQMGGDFLGLKIHFLKNKVEGVGQLPKQVDSLALKSQKAFYDTLWIYNKPNWYCLFKFQPILQIFNENLELIETQDIQDDLIQYQYSNNMERVSSGQTNQFLALFTDIKFFKGYLWIMAAPKTLLQVFPKTGVVKHSYRFFGKGDDFPRGQNGKNKCCLTLPFFTILEDGSLILGHPDLLWNHDLWKAELPPSSIIENFD